MSKTVLARIVAVMALVVFSDQVSAQSYTPRYNEDSFDNGLARQYNQDNEMRAQQNQIQQQQQQLDQQRRQLQEMQQQQQPQLNNFQLQLQRDNFPQPVFK